MGEGMSTNPNPAKESLWREQLEQRETERNKGRDAALSDVLANRFPASDSVAAVSATKPGSNKRTRH